MTWEQFKEAVDKQLDAKGISKDTEMQYIDTAVIGAIKTKLNKQGYLVIE